MFLRKHKNILKKIFTRKIYILLSDTEYLQTCIRISQFIKNSFISLKSQSTESKNSFYSTYSIYVYINTDKY